MGRCWATEEPQLIGNIAKNKSYITFDGRARSELAVPCFDLKGEFMAVMFAYSELENVFEETDVVCLEEIINYLDY